MKDAPSLNAGLLLIASFLDGLNDSHTYFEPPSRPYRLDYGYRLAAFGNDVFITRVRPGSDAAGKLEPGDQVLAVNGRLVTRKSLPAMQYILNTLSPQPATTLRLRDPSGAEREVTVNALVKKGQQILDLAGAAADAQFADLIRELEATELQYRQQHVSQDGVLIWKMPTFMLENAQIDQLLGQARRHETLILDLRGNPGGLVDALRRLAGGLFERDVTIADRVSRGSRRAITAGGRGKDAFRGRLIVLVDSASGSSSELLARIVQLEGRGTVIGDRTAGAVMESRVFPEAHGIDVLILYAFAVTSADVVMKDGKSLERAGVTPDEIVVPTAADLAAGRDPVLARAAAVAGLTLDPVAAGKLFPFEWRPF